MSNLIDFDNLDLNSTPNTLPNSIPSKLTTKEEINSPIKTKQSIKIINSIKTEICIQLFLNKILIIITQLGRIGSMIQINPPPPTAPTPISLSSSSHPSLFPSLPSPHPAITLSPIFGIAPTIKLNLLYDLYANQIGAIVFNDLNNTNSESEEGGGDGYGAELPVLLGIGLKIVKGENGEEEEGLTEEDRECFGEVMQMVKDCRVW